MSDKFSRRKFLNASGSAVLGGTVLAASTDSAAAHYTGLPIYTTDNLNVRSGPGTNYGVVATAEQYTGGYIIDGPVNSDGYTWWKIQFNGDGNNGRVTGWSVERYTAHADFSYPVVGQVSQEYKSGHAALDIAADTGTPVVASREGTVDVTGYESGGCGYYIKVGHGAGYQTMYCHLSDIHVSEGQSVGRHQHIGDCGSTGNSTGPHVHFTVEQNGAHQYVAGDLYDEIDDKTGIAKNYSGIGSF
ncbi:peptidoglycan DD-metalloendopeptidase family protein [Haladaptatus caseinilyticus]|uniref:peptidoglycan DD-metalloendopeptidase family protein n=1 Tax=Haladaptatus caseinilyticus TaxID=2993314 RepID=UPI00224AF49C|nr:peptidoglycan DD-metalloendopeptidase family protein [Haladaptatus caseinilyticus]